MERNITPLTETEESLLTIKYGPCQGLVEENPPRFTWVPGSDKDLTYGLEISKTPDFNEEDTKVYSKIPYNFYTLDHTLEEGTYYWRYTLDGEEYGAGRIRSFSVTDDLPKTPLTGREDRYQQAELGHPRLWLNQTGLKEFREKRKENPDYCGFAAFYRESVKPYLHVPFIKEPKPYPDNKRVVHLWRENYTICQEAMYAVRGLSVAGIILEDRELIEKARECLLELASWDVNGTTSREYNDECSFRVVYGLAFGYDWLYDVLTEEERKTVLASLLARTGEVADHVMVHSRIHFSLYDSHAVRSLSSVLTPCSIAMLGDVPKARDWLDYTIEYFSVIYTPWGGMDGGWAEGPMYWTTGMAYVIDALNLIKNYLGIDLYQRPFFQKTGDFPLYCNPVDTYRASFCDQSNLGKYPGHKTACNMRQFAGVTKNPWYQWYYEQVYKREPEIDPAFFNAGWWDFGFDEMVFQHGYGETKFQEQKPFPLVKWFRDIGWVAINKDPQDFDRHLFFLAKSSPYGSVSHSHGDQNSFLLFAYGEPLVIKSGHYVGFNTSMHRQWRRQTKSHNTLLIGGLGQYAGMDKAKQLTATGNICHVTQEESCVSIKMDATKAYQIENPDLVEYIREVYVVEEAYFVMVDSVTTRIPMDIDYRLHSLSPYELEGNHFSVIRPKARLDGQVVYASAGPVTITQSDCFEGVEEKELEGLEHQYHLNVKTKKALTQVLVTLLVPSKTGEKTVVTPIKDDQGHDVFHYFSYKGKTFSLRVDGNKRYENKDK